MERRDRPEESRCIFWPYDGKESAQNNRVIKTKEEPLAVSLTAGQEDGAEVAMKSAETAI